MRQNRCLRARRALSCFAVILLRVLLCVGILLDMRAFHFHEPAPPFQGCAYNSFATCDESENPFCPVPTQDILFAELACAYKTDSASGYSFVTTSIFRLLTSSEAALPAT